MIHMEGLTIGYGEKILLRNISAEARAGELTVLLGRNGSGKSSLIRTIEGLMKPSSGKITVAGKDLSGLGRREIARTVSFVSTERVRIPGLKCRDLVAMGRAPWTGWTGKTGPEDERITAAALRTAGMEDFQDRAMDKLSDGECQKAVIARAIAQDTPVMLLDEPTAFLDVPGKVHVASMLARLAREEGKCIIVSTHDIGTILGKADKVWLLDPPDIIVGSISDSDIMNEIRRVFGLEDGF